MTVKQNIVKEKFELERTYNLIKTTTPLSL